MAPTQGPHAQNVPLAEALAAFVHGSALADLPSEVRERARLHLLDSLGVALAAQAYPFSSIALDGAKALGDSGASTVIGRTDKLPMRDAVLVNGVALHGLDFDDTHLASIVHPSAGALPTALSLAEALDLTGGDLLTAYIIGMEAAIRLGLAIDGGLHHAGFHATGTLAHFSAALVAGKLLGLYPDQLVMAQGIAASTASGVQVFLEEGAWTKRFHPGWAAVAGITAANLARNGFVGPARPYEGRFGFFETHLPGGTQPATPEIVTSGLGELWHFLDTALKPYPVCHFIHGCADAAIAVHQELAGAEVRAVEAYLPAKTLPIIAEPLAAKQAPGSEYDAKFSAPFVVATCLLKGRFGLPDLYAEALADQDTVSLAGKVTCHRDPDSTFPQYFSGGVTVETADGRRLHRHVAVNSGAGERALDADGVIEKFMALACLSVSEAEAMNVCDAVLAVEQKSARALLEAVRPSPR